MTKPGPRSATDSARASASCTADSGSAAAGPEDDALPTAMNRQSSIVGSFGESVRTATTSKSQSSLEVNSGSPKPASNSVWRSSSSV